MVSRLSLCDALFNMCTDIQDILPLTKYNLWVYDYTCKCLMWIQIRCLVSNIYDQSEVVKFYDRQSCNLTYTFYNLILFCLQLSIFELPILVFCTFLVPIMKDENNHRGQRTNTHSTANIYLSNREDYWLIVVY